MQRTAAFDQKATRSEAAGLGSARRVVATGMILARSTYHQALLQYTSRSIAADCSRHLQECGAFSHHRLPWQGALVLAPSICMMSPEDFVLLANAYKRFRHATAGRFTARPDLEHKWYPQ